MVMRVQSAEQDCCAIASCGAHSVVSMLALVGSLFAVACGDGDLLAQGATFEGERSIDCEPSTPGSDAQAALEYYGTMIPAGSPPRPEGYEVCEPNVRFDGGLGSISHEATEPQGAGKFTFNRIYRSTKNGLERGDQFGIFHPWLHSFGNNSIEGGVWNNPFVAGPHYYPTLHLAGVGDTYHTCNDVQFGRGLYDVELGDRWLTMFQISNQVLFVPGVNIAFDKDQPSYDEDNGIWIGWGWTYLELDHPLDYKFWMSFIEAYDYQGPVNGYIPEHFNWIDPQKIASGDYHQRQQNNDPFGTFATLGSAPNHGVGNEQYTRGMQISDDVYYVPVSRVPSHKDREYVLANAQGISRQTMESYSERIRANDSSSALIEGDFVPFNGTERSTHGQLKIGETIEGEQHLTVVEPPFELGYDEFGGYIEWADSSPEVDQARENGNGYLYYRKTSEKWVVEGGASDDYRNHPHLYKSELIMPPDERVRVPSIDSRYYSYRERDADNPEFSNWDTSGMERYEAQLQNGSVATYVWFKFTEQPALKTAKQNWPSVYTDEYLEQLQSYVETIHEQVASHSRENPSEPVFINYRSPQDERHFEPHLAEVDPGQQVVPPAGLELGYVPVVISVYYPEEHSENGTGKVNQPGDACSNSQWSDSYFPDLP